MMHTDLYNLRDNSCRYDYIIDIFNDIVKCNCNLSHAIV